MSSPTAPIGRSMEIVALSAQGPHGLTQAARRVQQYLREHPHIPLGDLCGAIGEQAEPGRHRVALLAGSNEELDERLSGFIAGRKERGQLTGHMESAEPPRVVFMFTGQGSQYANMARELYVSLPAFRSALDRCAMLVDAHLEQPILSVMFPDADRPTPIHDTAFTQPALVALEYALAEVWRSWGVGADAVIGHSVGEYTAACVADVFSLEEGLRLIAVRGRLMQALPANGSMAVVFADESTVKTAVEPHRGTVSIAAVNGPNNIVISGATTGVETLLAFFKSQQIRTCGLPVSRAFHSPLMEPMLEPLTRAARRICYQRPRIPLVSNVTGDVLPPGHIPDAQYWRRHVRESVRFADGIRALCDRGYRIFLEVGPDPVLAGMARRAASDNDLVWVASLERGRDNWQTLLAAVATLYVQGVSIAWSALYPRDARTVLTLGSELTEPVLS